MGSDLEGPRPQQLPAFRRADLAHAAAEDAEGGDWGSSLLLCVTLSQSPCASESTFPHLKSELEAHAGSGC